MKQAFNPYLPSYEYIPDAEPHIFDGRVYIYGSHDRFNGISFCLNDYVCWSAPVDDLADWRYEGVIYRRSQDGKKHRGFLNSLFAPDVCCGPDGKYYLFYFVGYTGIISVAVCDEPAGQYEFLGFVRYRDGVRLGQKGEPIQFDPGVLVDDDGRIYLYTGFAPVDFPRILLRGHEPTKKGAMGFELEPDMLTIKEGPVYVGVPGKPASRGTGYEGHEFFEAASVRKFNGEYYMVYSSIHGHELCYARSESPLGPYKFGGTLVSIGDIGLGKHTSPQNAANFTGNTHGSVVQINGEYFVFYHRQTNRHQFSRQACAERLILREDGGFDQVEVTSCGLNRGPLKGKGKYEARIACNLYGEGGARFYGIFKGFKDKEPYFTQTGKDREDCPDQYIANICDGAIVGYKYFNFVDTNEICVSVKGTGRGDFYIYQDLTQSPIAVMPIRAGRKYQKFTSSLNPKPGVSGLYFRYRGHGRIDFEYFILK